MPIFSKPKSASLNPDKLPNKKVYERDKKRVKSGTPSASSKVDADTFTSLSLAVEEVKNDLIRIDDFITDFNEVDVGKLDYGNFLNLLSKASKLLAKVQSSSITTTQQIELQNYANKINDLYNSINEKNDVTEEEQQQLEEEGLRALTQEEKYNIKVIKFFKNILIPLKQFLILLNSKLVTSGNDSNRGVPVEVSGINAPIEPTNIVIPNVVGAGFRSSWRLEKGAVQYQNQKYI